ncbi:exonuclease 1 [Ambystoma mexicanum]|uniref:exonuclease 1 n=1 Tax=Ambystoma mexicanum TaxID=8296 RepID=UPI0037E78EE9
MGIQGLLQFLKEASEPIHVKKFKGQTVAVDTYCWIHKGAFACAEKLAKGEPTDQYVAYCMKFVDMLLACGIKPILVFDGCTLPSKKEVEKSRRERRQTNLQKGKQLLREGKLSEARECFTRCVNVTPAMAHAVIKAAWAHGVDCIVAPYEADSQLAFLNKTGIAQAIITEDSDLLAFGCKKVILKMDKFGNGLEIDQERLGMCKQLGDVFTEEKFRYMCILSGCDYLASLHGIGLAKACKLLRIANNPDIIKVIKKIGQYLKMNITVPDDYIAGFIRANNTFLYQLVFDPLNRKLVPLNPYAEDIDPEILDYAGRNIGDHAAFQIAIGNKDINTMEQIDNYNPDNSQSSQPKSRRWSDSAADRSTIFSSSIWNRSYRPSILNTSTSPTQCKEAEKPSTKGIEKVISTKGLKLPRKEQVVKRPREELSDVDLLSQYSFSKTKKAKQESSEETTPPKSSTATSTLHLLPNSGKESLNSQHKVRNKFATLLQRKNEEPGTIVVPGTRSRFFCNSASEFDCPARNGINKSPNVVTLSSSNVINSQGPTKDLLTLAEEIDVFQDSQSHKEVCGLQPSEEEMLKSRSPIERRFKCQSPKKEKHDSHSPKKGLCGSSVTKEENCGSPSPKEDKCAKPILVTPLGTPKSCFSWSGSLGGESPKTPSSSPGLLALQQYYRKTECLTPRFQNNLCTTLHNGSLRNNDPQDKEVLPARSSECSPQSSQVGELSQVLPTAPTLSNGDSILEESSDNHTTSVMSSPYSNTKVTEGIKTTARSKVPGLHKSKSVGPGLTTKLKPLLPAKASGLSRKSLSAQKKNVRNNENKPGLQVTISDLWKQFGFKKDSEKISSSKSPEPLSPVKDNLVLTPETEEDIYNKPDCLRVQRSIFT